MNSCKYYGCKKKWLRKILAPTEIIDGRLCRLLGTVMVVELMSHILIHPQGWRAGCILTRREDLQNS